MEMGYYHLDSRFICTLCVWGIGPPLRFFLLHEPTFLPEIRENFRNEQKWVGLLNNAVYLPCRGGRASLWHLCLNHVSDEVSLLIDKKFESSGHFYGNAPEDCAPIQCNFTLPSTRLRRKFFRVQISNPRALGSLFAASKRGP